MTNRKPYTEQMLEMLSPETRRRLVLLLAEQERAANSESMSQTQITRDPDGCGD